MTSEPAAPADDGSQFRLPVLVLMLLTLTAGFADGHALTRFDVFVANQSGNIVRIGMGLVGQYSAWDLALLSVLGFAVGAMVSWALARWSPLGTTRLVRSRVLAVIVLAAGWWVAAALLTPHGTGGLATAFIGAAAMGVMATVLTHVAGVSAQTTFQTATVIRTAQGALDWVARTDSGNGRRLALVSAVTLGCYAAGGALGALSTTLSDGALLLALLPLVAVLALVRPLSSR